MLLRILDAAARTLAEGYGAAKVKDQRSAYQRAPRVVQRFEAGGHVLPSIAHDLLGDAAALLADIQAQT